MAQNYDVLISYDINTKHDSAVHTAVKDCMIAKGYADRLTDSHTKKTVYLPNTTLWKKNIDAAIAREDLDNCITEYNKKHTTKHETERCIALEFTSLWHAKFGLSHSANSTSPEKLRTT